MADTDIFFGVVYFVFDVYSIYFLLFPGKQIDLQFKSNSATHRAQLPPQWEQCFSTYTTSQSDGRASPIVYECVNTRSM